jgi:hypothetical protein
VHEVDSCRCLAIGGQWRSSVVVVGGQQAIITQEKLAKAKLHLAAG